VRLNEAGNPIGWQCRRWPDDALSEDFCLTIGLAMPDWEEDEDEEMTRGEFDFDEEQG
jgi:hypothetical protein